jgi:hypothetical protein
MLFLLLGCGLPEAPEELYGMWANTDEGFVRAWDMKAEHDGFGPAYLIYNYDEGTDPALVQVGTYDILEEHIVTSPDGDTNDYSNLIVDWGGSWFELEVDKATGDTRVYESVDELP